MPVQNGMGAPGLDFYTCWRGWFIAIETKVPGKKLTPRQWETAKQIANAGGAVFAVRTKDDVTNMITTLTKGQFFRLGCVYDELGPPNACEGVTSEPMSGGA
jgi:hypothetical protein